MSTVPYVKRAMTVQERLVRIEKAITSLALSDHGPLTSAKFWRQNAPIRELVEDTMEERIVLQ